MSIKSAKAFIERMKTDGEFANQVASRKDKEERMKSVIEEGFEFSEQEITHVTQELTDDDLELVAAGDRGVSAAGFTSVEDDLWQFSGLGTR